MYPILKIGDGFLASGGHDIVLETGLGGAG